MMIEHTVSFLEISVFLKGKTQSESEKSFKYVNQFYSLLSKFQEITFC